MEAKRGHASRLLYLFFSEPYMKTNNSINTTTTNSLQFNAHVLAPFNPPPQQVPMTPPTLAMSFGANDGPLGGRSGGVFVNANQVKARLTKEVENNVTLLLRQNLTDTDQLEVRGPILLLLLSILPLYAFLTPSFFFSHRSCFCSLLSFTFVVIMPSLPLAIVHFCFSLQVHAKGELQLGILIEEMRREKYEMCVSPPRILTVPCPETGDMLEPIEEVTIDVDQVRHHLQCSYLLLPFSSDFRCLQV